MPKYNPLNDHQVITDPIEQWCFFFLKANELTSDQIAERLPNAAFTEATRILEMIARDPKQRNLYESRLKAERDAQAKEDYARQQGIEQGIEQGELLGQAKLVSMLSSLVGEPGPCIEDLVSLGRDKLESMEADLQRRLRERNKS